MKESLIQSCPRRRSPPVPGTLMQRLYAVMAVSTGSRPGLSGFSMPSVRSTRGRHLPDTRRSQSGFTLIEVLIAIAVLGIGMLGLAGLQTQGIRYGYTSFLLTVATQQAEDMIERMRANPGEVATVGGYYDNLSGSATMPTDCSVEQCDSLERAQYDHSVWNARNSALFGQTGTVQRLGGVFQVQLSWNEVDNGGSTAAQTYTVVFRP